MRLIKDGQVLIDNHVEKKDILIDEGKIIQIDDSIVKDCDVIDAAGLTVIRISRCTCTFEIRTLKKKQFIQAV